MLHVLGDILLVTSADESRRQIVVCPPVYAAGLAVSPCGVASADERRRQIVICPPFYAAGLAISPCGAVLLTRFSIFISSGVCLSNLPQVPGAKSTPHRSYVRYYALHAGVRVPFLEFNFVRRVSRRLPKHKKMTIAE
jgi:hypothetical protein